MRLSDDLAAYVGGQQVDAMYIGDTQVFGFGVAACGYPLNGTELEIQTLFGAGYYKANTSSDQQEITYEIQSGLSAIENYMAVPAGLPTPPLMIDMSHGLTAVEVQISGLPAMVGGSGLVAAQVNFYSPAGDLQVGCSALSDGTYGVTAIGVSLTPVSVFGLIYDVSDGHTYVRIDGINYDMGEVDFSSTFPIAGIAEASAVDDSLIGTMVSVRIETNAANFLGSYDPGTVDPCGNLV